MTCTSLTKLQNDEVAWFDRQVNLNAILNSRKYEVPDRACKRLLPILHQTKYHVKTALCISEASYNSTLEYSHYGLVQWSRCAGTT